MATVCLAHQVALKVLRPELAANLGPERFLLGINTTGQLAHRPGAMLLTPLRVPRARRNGTFRPLLGSNMTRRALWLGLLLAPLLSVVTRPPELIAQLRNPDAPGTARVALSVEETIRVQRDAASGLAAERQCESDHGQVPLEVTRSAPDYLEGGDTWDAAYDPRVLAARRAVERLIFSYCEVRRRLGLKGGDALSASDSLFGQISIPQVRIDGQVALLDQALPPTLLNGWRAATTAVGAEFEMGPSTSKLRLLLGQRTQAQDRPFVAEYIRYWDLTGGGHRDSVPFFARGSTLSDIVGASAARVGFPHPHSSIFLNALDPGACGGFQNVSATECAHREAIQLSFEIGGAFGLLWFEGSRWGGWVFFGGGALPSVLQVGAPALGFGGIEEQLDQRVNLAHAIMEAISQQVH